MTKYIYLFLFLWGAYQLPAQCVEDINVWKNTWASCQRSANPNSNRGVGHWIMYDFGDIYALSTMRIWNTNDPNKLNQGFKEVIIDYSTNGQDWAELGTFEFRQGLGTGIYGGFNGPDFKGKQAQFVVITAVSNWGDPTCYGLAEVKFNIASKPDPQFLTTSLEGDEQSLLDDVPVVLYPNPAKDEVTLRYLSEQTEPVVLKVYDLMGALIWAEELAVNAGRNEFEFNTEGLARGIYMVRLHNQQSTAPIATKRLIVVGNK